MDHKNRWGGLLEIPLVSKIQRDILDFGRTGGLKQIIGSYEFASVLDVGCGLGETSTLFNCPYLGIDDSQPRIAYAARRYPRAEFRCLDARQLPFEDRSFDAVMMIDASHHLSDQEFLSALREMRRVAARYVIISDPVCFPGQGTVSRFFYGLDRGGCFRTAEQMLCLIGQAGGFDVRDCGFFTTFPGLYRHAVWILALKTVPQNDSVNRG